MKEQHIFFAPDIAATSELPEEESGHAVKVLRMKEGMTIDITDGNGKFYEAEIVLADKRHTRVQIVNQQEVEKTWQGSIHLAVAPTKNMSRIEWLCEKATEIGFDAITLLHCDYSERHHVSADRLERILVSAMKQSQKAQLPVLTALTPFKTLVDTPFPGQRFIAHCYDDASISGEESCDVTRTLPFLGDVANPDGEAQVLIGPEGDFSIAEVRYALERGFIPVSLGKSRLRTETAALVAVHILNLKKRYE